MSIPLIVFHANCLDGFGSAYAAWVHFKLNHQIEAEYLPASHGEEPPDVTGRTVYLVDFAYKREPMELLCRQAEKVIVLDHHITAQEQLQGLDKAFSNAELLLDMDRSGAMITWEYFHSEPAPKLIACIQDRDMWRWEIPDSRNLNTGLMSHPFSFEGWHQAANDERAWQKLLDEGAAINRFREQMIAQHKRAAVMGMIAGYEVPIVNCPRVIVSELLGELAEGYPFAAGYTDKGSRRTWSLRAGERGIDVAKIAEQFGGGGHQKAAGFATDIGESHLTFGS